MDGTDMMFICLSTSQVNLLRTSQSQIARIESMSFYTILRSHSTVWTHKNAAFPNNYSKNVECSCSVCNYTDMVNYSQITKLLKKKCIIM